MKIEHMKEFMELIRTRNYSRAAEPFFLSQSALSKHIQMIEEELQVSLLNRSNPGVELTDAGKYVLEEFRKMLDIYETMEDNLHEMTRGYSGKLKIGLPYYATEKYLIPIMSRFKESYPKIRLCSYSGQINSLYEAVLSGDVDCSFLIENCDIPVNYGKEIEVIPIYSENEVVLCRKDNTIKKDNSIDLQVLSGQKLLIYEDGEYMKTYNTALVRWIEAQGVFFSEKILIENIDFISEAVIKTNAIAIMPEHIKDYHSKLSFVRLKNFPKVSMCVVKRKDNSNPTLNLFINTASKICH